MTDEKPPQSDPPPDGLSNDAPEHGAAGGDAHEPHIPLTPSERPTPSPGPTPAERPAARSPLTEGFTEEEIEAIEREPESRPNSKKVRLDPEADIPEDALAAPGRLGWRAPLVIGTLAIVAAVVLAAVYHRESVAWWRAALRQLIDAPLYAWIGVGALLAAARLQERPFGGVHYAAARMTLAVGLFALIWQLTAVLVFEQQWPGALRWPLAAIPGAAVYWLWTMYSFRLDREGAAMLGFLHLLAWVVLWIFRNVHA